MHAKHTLTIEKVSILRLHILHLSSTL